MRVVNLHRISLVLSVLLLLAAGGFALVPDPGGAAFCDTRPNHWKCRTTTTVPTTTTTTVPATGWTLAFDDQFNDTTVPAHWNKYQGKYSSSGACASPTQLSVSGGSLHMLFQYKATGECGAGWYSGGMSTLPNTIDQRITLRWRVVSNGVVSHKNIPFRWPSPDSSWPAAGEENLCEGSSITHCNSFFHYGATNSQVVGPISTFDQTQWHTTRYERLNFTIKAYVDDLATPAWTYAGNSTTLPATVKHPVLQQECVPGACPSGTTGTEDIQVDWLTVETPA